MLYNYLPNSEHLNEIVHSSIGFSPFEAETGNRPILDWRSSWLINEAPKQPAEEVQDKIRKKIQNFEMAVFLRR